MHSAFLNALVAAVDSNQPKLFSRPNMGFLCWEHWYPAYSMKSGVGASVGYVFPEVVVSGASAVGAGMGAGLGSFVVVVSAASVCGAGVGALVGGQVSIRSFAMQTCVPSFLGALKYPVLVYES